ncbi:MAG: cation transporter, partial [Bdellovibrionales bacterium]
MEKIKHKDNCCDSDSPKVESKILNHIEGSSVSTFSVLGMDCADEIAAIQKSLTHSRIAKVTANLMTSQVSVEHDPSLKKEEIVALINKSGVKVQETSRQLSFVAANKNRVILVSLSGAFLVIGLICQWFLE